MTSPERRPAFAAGVLACVSAMSAPFAVAQAEPVGDLRRDRLDLHADVAARHRAVLAQLRDHVARDAGGDREADADAAAGRRVDRRVHADDVAVEIERRAARVAAVHRRVDLDEVVIGARADVAAARRDDAGRHRAAEAERIADREHPVADARDAVRPTRRTGNCPAP